MKCVKGLGFLWVAVLAAFFALWGCDDSSSASGNGPDENAAAESSSTTVNKDKSSESKTGDEISSSDEQDAGNTIEHSSSSRKTTSKSESSSSVVVSSSSVDEDLIPCSVEGRRAQVGPEMLEYICENGFLVPYIAPSSSSLSLHAKDSITHPDEIFLDGGNFSFYIDSREGLEKKYTVLREHTSSGDTLYVFVDNLNYGKQVLSSETEFDDNVVEKYCYNDDPWYCDNYYGALYTWSEAMALPKVCESLSQEDSRCQIKTSKKGGHQGICPDGWFVMTVNNWSDAYHDDYGMSRSSLSYAGDLHTYLGLIYTGHLEFGKDTAEYEGIWESAYFWSASENTSSDEATAFYTYNSMYPQTDYDAIVSKRNAYPVRCARIVEEAE